MELLLNKQILVTMCNYIKNVVVHRNKTGS